jgi:hypothetical protein
METVKIDYSLLEELKKSNGILKHLQDKFTIYEDIKKDKLIRIFADESTKTFTNIFFAQNQNILKNYITYCYNLINFNIQTNINYKILDMMESKIHDERIKTDEEKALINIYQPLNPLETITVLFKGGTEFNYIMNFFKNFIIKKNPTAEILGKLNEESFMEKFGVSDTDFSIYIKSLSSDRFQIINRNVNELVYGAVDSINEFFEYLWTNNNIQEPDSITIDNLINRISVKRRHKLKQEMPIHISELQNHIKNLKTKILLNDNYDNIIEFLDKLMSEESTMNCQYNSFIIEFIDFVIISDYILFLKTNLNKIPVDKINLLKEFRKDLYLLSMIDLVSFRNNFKDFYKEELKAKFKIELDKNIINLFKSKDGKPAVLNVNDKLIKAKTIPAKYEILKIPESRDIIIKNNNNIFTTIPPILLHFFKEKNLPRMLVHLEDIHYLNPSNLQDYVYPKSIRGDDKTCINNSYLHALDNATILNKNVFSNISERTHYITLNHTINYIAQKSINRQFNLCRIKFNIILNNCLKNITNSVSAEPISEYIPSEFLDMSCIGYYEIKTDPYKEQINKENILYIKLSNYSIPCMNYLQIIYDLEYMLYRQFSFFPWINPKYKKRITRLMFFIFIYLRVIKKMNLEEFNILITDFLNLHIFLERDLKNPDSIEFSPDTKVLINKMYLNDEQILNVDYISDKILTGVYTSFDQILNLKPDYILISDMINSIIMNSIFFMRDKILRKTFPTSEIPKEHKQKTMEYIVLEILEHFYRIKMNNFNSSEYIEDFMQYFKDINSELSLIRDINNMSGGIDIASMAVNTIPSNNSK